MLCRTGSGTGWCATARASGTGAPGNDRVGRGAAMQDGVGGQPARDGHAKQSTDARRARRLSGHGDRVRGYPESADVAAHSAQGRDHCQEAEGWRRRRRGDMEAVGQGTPRRGCRLRSSGVRAVVAEPAHQCSLRHGDLLADSVTTQGSPGMPIWPRRAVGSAGLGRCSQEGGGAGASDKPSDYGCRQRQTQPDVPRHRYPSELR
jgi:hypothetical protein